MEPDAGRAVRLGRDGGEGAGGDVCVVLLSWNKPLKEMGVLDTRFFHRCIIKAKGFVYNLSTSIIIVLLRELTLSYSVKPTYKLL